MLCAGVTVYKGLKMTDTRPGQWVVISGIGGLGHMAVQYARAMGLNVAAVDVDDAKLELARRLGATVTVNAMKEDPASVIKRDIGGAHGALVTAVSPKAFDQAQNMLRRGGTLVLNGLPPGDFPLPIFSTVLNGITVRGSIVGTRQDLQEALDFAAEGKVAATVQTGKLEDERDDIKQQLVALTRKREALSQQQTAQKAAVAEEMAALYRLGRQPELKLLLNQDDPARLERLQVYLNHLSVSRRAALERLAELNQSLADTRAQLLARQTRLETAW